MDKPALVVFDLGGTTIQDSGQMPAALVSALGAAGMDVSPAEIAALRGASKREAIRQMVARRMPDSGSEIDARTDSIFALFRQHLAQSFTSGGAQPMPGASETFTWLRQHHILIAFNTGFDRASTTLLLKAAGWDRDVARAVVCGDEVAQGRPAPYMIFHAMEIAGVTAVSQVAVVGDTVLDLLAAANAGVRWNIGVLSRAGALPQLEAAPHTALLPSVADLPALWEETT